MVVILRMVCIVRIVVIIKLVMIIGRLGQINWETLVVSSNSDYIARQMCKYYNQDRPSKFLYFSLNVVFDNLFQQFNGELKLCHHYQSFFNNKNQQRGIFFSETGWRFSFVQMCTVVTQCKVSIYFWKCNRNTLEI